MSDQPHEQHSVESILGAIANWVEKYRHVVGLRGEFANCQPEEVARMARDIGVSPQELKFFVKKGPDAANELPRLLCALGVDPQELASHDPNKMLDLQRLCITCGDKNQCRHDLAAGTAASHHHNYCPNAMAIDAIFRSSSKTG